jgi:hypothetical protein
MCTYQHNWESLDSWSGLSRVILRYITQPLTSAHIYTTIEDLAVNKLFVAWFYPTVLVTVYQRFVKGIVLEGYVLNEQL